MKISELLNEHNSFHADTTEMPFYDNMMANPDYFAREKGLEGKLVDMSPMEYVRKVAQSKGITREEMLGNRDPATITKYANLMKAGNKFPILTLDYSSGRLSQEGLHRAFAAEEAGISEIPVLVVDLTDEEKEWIKNNR